jgi:hypothetical protein
VMLLGSMVMRWTVREIVRGRREGALRAALKDLKGCWSLNDFCA